MTRVSRILHALPATVCELAAIESASVKLINSHLYNLRRAGKATRTKKRGQRYGLRGPAPSIWELA